MQATSKLSQPNCGHTIVHSSCPDCAALVASWDTRLAKAGFEDAEQREDGNLKTWASSDARACYRPNYWEAKEEYYRLAGQFLWEHQFATKKERHMWELHAAGHSIRDIVLTLKKKNFLASRNVVAKIIQQLEVEMKKKYIDGT